MSTANIQVKLLFHLIMHLALVSILAFQMPLCPLAIAMLSQQYALMEYLPLA